MRYDVAVVGSGPAGLEAAINLKIRNKSFVLFGSKQLSQKVERAPSVLNYLGFPSITGRELQQRFADHLAAMEIEVTAEQATTVYPMGDYFAIATSRGTWEATAVILATGTFAGKPLPGEERLLGRGVGYCATCDAPLYRGKRVAILGWGDEAVYEANFVSEIAETVYYLPVSPASTPLSDSIRLLEGKAVEIAGTDKVTGLVLQDRTVEVDGVFVLRETIAPDSLVPGIALAGGFVRVDTDMRTNLEGCFAAGDCTGKPHQYIRAAGQGQTAALNAVAWLDQKAAAQKKAQES